MSASGPLLAVEIFQCLAAAELKTDSDSSVHTTESLYHQRFMENNIYIYIKKVFVEASNLAGGWWGQRLDNWHF